MCMMQLPAKSDIRSMIGRHWQCSFSRPSALSDVMREESRSPSDELPREVNDWVPGVERDVVRGLQSSAAVHCRQLADFDCSY